MGTKLWKGLLVNAGLLCLYECVFNWHHPFFLSQVTGMSVSPGRTSWSSSTPKTTRT